MDAIKKSRRQELHKTLATTSTIVGNGETGRTAALYCWHNRATSFIHQCSSVPAQPMDVPQPPHGCAVAVSDFCPRA